MTSGRCESSLHRPFILLQLKKQNYESHFCLVYVRRACEHFWISPAIWSRVVALMSSKVRRKYFKLLFFIFRIESLQLNLLHTSIVYYMKFVVLVQILIILSLECHSYIDTYSTAVQFLLLTLLLANTLWREINKYKFLLYLSIVFMSPTVHMAPRWCSL